MSDIFPLEETAGIILLHYVIYVASLDFRGKLDESYVH
jgi:hypothetical protein